MNYCPNCGQQLIQPAARFCAHCGTPLTANAPALTVPPTKIDKPSVDIQARKKQLTTLHHNLNILREREAKYGSNSPLELLNQIEDHLEAVQLIEQAMGGHLSERELEEALKPLLLAFNNGQVVNIEAETYIAGDVKGDFIRGNIINLFRSGIDEAKERRNQLILLEKVKSFWIEGVLEKSLHGLARIELGKEAQIEAVARQLPGDIRVEIPDQGSYPLSPQQKLIDIFDEAEQALLILGAPGAGKTISLLELARDLIHRTEHDPTQPIPVIFNLASWPGKQSLVDWLVEELTAKYQIPRRIGRVWIEQDELLLLLDGLDEVALEHRTACVEAINQFRQERGLTGIIVVSRRVEYEAIATASTRLRLQGAIRLLPLSATQIDNYLATIGPPLAALRTSLHHDPNLQELAQSPLMLSIMSLAYQNMSVDTLAGQALDTVIQRRHHLFDTYIERMFKRKAPGNQPYPPEQTKDWLSWLAQQMSRHNQSIFLIEGLQPGWLSSPMWLWVYVLGSRLLGGLVFTIPSWPFFGAVFGLLVGLLCGLSLGVMDILRFELNRKKGDKTTLVWWNSASRVLVLGLVIGLSITLVSQLRARPVIGLMFAPLFGLTGGLIFGFKGGRQSLTNDIKTVESLKWSWLQGLKSGGIGLIVGVIFSLIAGLIAGLIVEPIVQMAGGQTTEVPGGYRIEGLNEQTINGLKVGPIFGLITGLVFGPLGAVFGGLKSSVVEIKTLPNQGIRLSIKNAVFTGLIVGLIGVVNALLIGSLSLGMLAGLFFGMSVALLFGGLDVIQHYTLRLILYFQGYTPFNYIRFLDYAAKRIFLQKVGGGYIFIHRLLQEHFAAMGGTVDSAEGG